jgi:cytochrome c oxidase subunit I+III
MSVTSASVKQTIGNGTSIVWIGCPAMTAVDWCGGSSCSGQLTFALVIMELFTIERHAAGKLDRERRVTFDNLALLYHYTVVQSLLGLALIHGFPRLVG